MSKISITQKFQRRIKKLKRIKKFVFLLTLPVPLYAQVNWNAPESVIGEQREISFASGKAVVVTANSLASDAALRTLKKGGSAMDAVITAQTVLAVVEPQSSGLGGGGFLLYWDQGKKSLQAIDGRETASAHSKKDTWLKPNGTPVPWLNATSSLSAIGVPGTTALLWEGHRQFGNLPWEANFRESIHLAKEGFIPSPRFLQSISLAKQIGITHSPTFKSLYLPNGRLPSQKVPFRNQSLALTLTRLAKGGVSEFYRGAISKELIKDLQLHQNNKIPSQTITYEDLANYRVHIRKPICQQYRSWRICSMPPPSGGGVAILQALGTYELLSKKGWSDQTTNHWHILAESLRIADADRSHWIGDPIDWPIPAEGLISKSYIEKRSKIIQFERTILSPLPGNPKGSESFNLASQPRTSEGGTTHLVVVDLQGNIASYTGSVETVFGSRHISGGMILNNQLTDFSFLPNIKGKPIANRIGPNKRPMSSMSPVIVFRDGRPVIAIGSPGGWLIPHYVTTALIRSLDFELPPSEVVSRKLLAVQPNKILLEKLKNWSYPQSKIRKDLKALGHQIKDIHFSSGLALIQWNKGSWHGAADPRREGKAVSLPFNDNSKNRSDK